MKRVFMSGPYSSDPWGNTLEAALIQQRLMDLGFSVFCPQTAYHWLNEIRPRSYTDWMSACLEELRRSDVVLRWHRTDIPELDASPGSDTELANAERIGLPVFEDEEDLCLWQVREETKDAA